MFSIDDSWFSEIIRPSRYIGGEVNLIRKDPDQVQVTLALAYPDVYEVGMSHLGLKILYHLLNGEPWLAAERVFAPWVDMDSALRRRDIPLSSLESNRPLHQFDLVGFSLQHELSYTNVLNMLDLGRIPLRASERTESHPLVIAGGPACFNPEPVADFFDAVVIGDGETAALEICRSVRRFKGKDRQDREKLLSEWRHIRGVYVPSLFHVHHRRDGIISRIEPVKPDYPIVNKAVLPDIDAYPFPESQVVPYTELVHDRLAVEIARGCTRGCRFCQAGMIYRPVRERSPESIMEKARRGLRRTGYDDLSLLSLSSGDYSCIEAVLQRLMDMHAGNKVAVSLPSLRVDSLSETVLEQIKRVRKTGFTLAPEAGSERLRRIINKGLSRSDILEMGRIIYEAGWNLIKLYFMVGLPMEEEADIEAIMDLAGEVARIAGRGGGKARLNVSVATFVPKAHTPFMWVPQITLHESRRRVNRIREGLKHRRIRVKWNQPEMSWLEGIFSRGDRRLSRVVMEAWERGARFDAWGEHFDLDVWRRALDVVGTDPAFYLHRERDPDEVLPWDHISSGVTKTFLKKEWRRAREAKPTADCRQHCLECGVCDHEEIDPVLFGDRRGSLPARKSAPTSSPGPSVKWRLTFTKRGPARYLGHLELVRVFLRTFKRAGLELVHSKGFHPTPRVSFACALPVGTESLEETLILELKGPARRKALMARINGELPPGLSVTDAEEVPLENTKMRLRESHFHIAANGVRLDERRLSRFLDSPRFPLTKVTRKGKKEIDARTLVKSIRLTSHRTLELVVTHRAGPELKPSDIVRGVFSLDENEAGKLKILKTRQILA